MGPSDKSKKRLVLLGMGGNVGAIAISPATSGQKRSKNLQSRMVSREYCPRKHSRSTFLQTPRTERRP
jgi:hypothetical protein